MIKMEDTAESWGLKHFNGRIRTDVHQKYNIFLSICTRTRYTPVVNIITLSGTQPKKEPLGQ